MCLASARSTVFESRPVKLAAASVNASAADADDFAKNAPTPALPANRPLGDSSPRQLVLWITV